MIDIPRFSLVKPNLNTPFHIDFQWWKAQDNNWRIFLFSCLCTEHQAAYSTLENDEWIDWIDPDTGEVQRVDGLQHILISHCAKQNEFVTQNTTLVDAVFRAFLANGNNPMTPAEISKQISRSPDIILKTFAGPHIYKGIRPCHK